MGCNVSIVHTGADRELGTFQIRIIYLKLCHLRTMGRGRSGTAFSVFKNTKPFPVS